MNKETTLYARGVKATNIAYLKRVAKKDTTTVGHILNKLLDSKRAQTREKRNRQLPPRRK